MWITIWFIFFVNNFLYFHSWEVNRTHIYLIPSTLSTFKEQVFAIWSNMKRHYVLVFPFVYLRFFCRFFYNINNRQFILSNILVTRKLIFILYQRRRIFQWIDYPEVSQQTVIITYNIDMAIIGTPKRRCRYFSILPSFLFTSIRKVFYPISSQLHLGCIHSQCFIPLHIQVVVLSIQNILFIRRKSHPTINWFFRFLLFFFLLY